MSNKISLSQRGIVIIKVHHDIAGGQVDAEVPLAADAEVLIQRHVHHVRMRVSQVTEELGGLGGLAVQKGVCLKS